MQKIQQVFSGTSCFFGLRGLPALPQQVWTVDDDRTQYSSADFTTIQAAIDAASPGDTILVFPGEYQEALTISKPLTLYGNGAYVNPTPTGRMDGESMITGEYAVTIASSSVLFCGFELSGFRYGINLPSGSFIAPDHLLSQITLSYLWLHSETAWVGINAEGGTLKDFEVSHSIIDLFQEGTETPAYALAGISFSEHPQAAPFYQNIVIRSNILRNRNGYYNLFAGSQPSRYTVSNCTIECNHFLNRVDSTLPDGANFNMGNITNGRFESNIVEGNPGSIGISGGVIRGNSFLRGGCLRLWGTEYGFTIPSQNLQIENNEFSDEVFGNGLHLRQGVLADTITCHYNSFADSGISPVSLLEPAAGFCIRNDTSLIHDAAMNWWGYQEGPSRNSGKLYGSTITAPWITEFKDFDSRSSQLCWPLSSFRKKKAGFYPQVITKITYIGETCFEPGACVELAALVSFTGGSGKGIPVEFTLCGKDYHTCTLAGGYAFVKVGCLCRGSHTVTAAAEGKTVATTIHICCSCKGKD